MDYGKEAYLQVEQLVKRIKSLEKANSRSEEKEIDLSFKVYIEGNVEKTISFYSEEEGEGRLYAEIPSTAQIWLNSNQLLNDGGIVDGNFIFKKGNNSIRIAFAYSSGENVDCLIKVYGSVENRLIGRFLLPIGGDYYSFSDGDYFSVYKVGESLPQVALYGVSSAAARYDGEKIVVVYIDSSGNISMEKWLQGEKFSYASVPGKAYGKFTLNVKNGRTYLYGVRGNYLWSGLIGADGTLVDSKTGLRAKDVAFGYFGYADGGLLVTDVDGNIVACILSASDPRNILRTVGLGKKNNANFFVSGVTFGKNGDVVLLNYDGNKFTDGGIVGIGDEMIKTDDGNKVVRVGREIKII